MLSLLKRHWATALFLLLAGTLATWVTWEGIALRMITWEPGTDYWEHSATLHALIDNPWHPWHPHLATHQGSPRFGPQFLLIALLARALHWNALQAMSFAGAFNIVLFLCGIYAFFKTFFGVALAPLYGLLVMFGGWWAGFHFSNVYSLPQLFATVTFPSTTALGLTLLGFALCVRLLRGKAKHYWPCVALLGVWSAFVFIIHPLTAAMSISGALLLCVTEPRVSWRRRLQVGAAIVIGCGLSHFWPYFSPWVVVRGGHGESADWATESAKQATGELQMKHRLHQFYRPIPLLSTVGLGALTVVTLPWFLLKRERWFVALGMLSMLVPFVANAYIEVPLGHRFVLLAIVYMHIGVVWILLGLTPRHARSFRFVRPLWVGIPSTLIVIAALGVFVVHSVRDAWGQQQNPRYTSRTTSPLVGNDAVIADFAGPGAVILANPQVSWSLPTFGPKVLLLYHMDPLVPDAAARSHDVLIFLRSPLSDEQREAIIQRYGVTHVLLQRERGPVTRFLDERATVRNWGSYRLYTLKPPAKPQ